MSDPSEALIPDSPVLADHAAAWRSAYVHIPFCARRCPYCDFAVVTPDEMVGSQDRYLRAVEAEIAMEPPWHPLDAVYVGGGTPTQVSPQGLSGLLSALADRFGLTDSAEVSLEANPEDWSASYADALVAGGFNRVSFGAQSTDDAILGVLGRAHRGTDMARTVAEALDAGFMSVNVDAIYGTPGETVASWERTVMAVVESGAHHLSAYALTVEPGTALSRAVIAGGNAPDPDDQADKYQVWTDVAAAAGLVRYEVSNAARTGHAVRYNLSTWAQGEYVAFGLGAHGHRDGIRRRNLRRMDRYQEAVEAGLRPEAGFDRIDGWDREVERLVLGLRRAAGVVIGEGGARLVASPEGKRLLAAGVIGVEGDRIVVKQPLLTDAASRAVLSLSP